MFRPVEVKALPNYKIWLRYSDGVEREVDLSQLVERGVFSAWNDYREFEKVHISPKHSVAWNNQLDLCPNNLYLEITGKTPEEVFPALQRKAVHT